MNIQNRMRPVHPGEILADELDVLEMSAKAFAEALNVPGNRITAILKGQRGVSADTSPIYLSPKLEPLDFSRRGFR